METLEILKCMHRAHKEIKQFIQFKKPLDPEIFPDHLQLIQLKHKSPEGNYCTTPINVSEYLNNPELIDEYESDTTIPDNEIHILFACPLSKTFTVRASSETNFPLFMLIDIICLTLDNILGNVFEYPKKTIHKYDIIPRRYLGIKFMDNITEKNPFGLITNDFSQVYIDYLIYDKTKNLVYPHMYITKPSETSELKIANPIHIKTFLQNLNFTDLPGSIVIPDNSITIKFTYPLKKILFIKHISHRQEGYTLRDLCRVISRLYRRIYSGVHLAEDPNFAHETNVVEENPLNPYGIKNIKLKELFIKTLYYDKSKKLLTMEIKV